MPGLTKAQAISQVQQGLGWRSDKSAEIVTMMDVVQYEELERGTTLPWFLATEFGEATLSQPGSDSGWYTLPTGFIRFYDEEAGLWVYVDAVEPAIFPQRKSLSWLTAWQQSGEPGPIPPGIPRWYGVYPTIQPEVLISPAPSEISTVYVNYYFHDAAPSGLASGQQNEWLKHASGALVNLTGLRMAEDLEHETAAAKFQKRYALANTRLVAESVAWEIGDREYVMGSLV